MKIIYSELSNLLQDIKKINSRGYISILFFLILILFVYINNANANIYMRHGKKGIVYFSNVPVSSKYKVFMITVNKHHKSSYKILKYRKLIQRAAKRYNINKGLIEAVIKAESGYRKTAVSDKGAEGLMQLMPATQRILNVSNPFNPAQNIYAGTKYLKSLLVKYNDNVSIALAAYNAGKNAVKQYRGIPPYAQTQNYVKEVSAYYKRYRKK
jgi:soluble lytic murein transglycosylase-like protein